MKHILLGGLAIAIIVIGIVGLVTIVQRGNSGSGFQPGIGGGPEDQSPTPRPTDGTTATARANLHRLLQEHAVLASAHLENLYDDENTTNSRDRLDENTRRIVQALNYQGGSDSQAQLLTMWNAHITEYEVYTMALKQDDTTQQAQAADNLKMHAAEFGNFMQTLNSTLNPEDITNKMNEHGALTLAIIEAHAEENTSQKLAQAAQASAQAAEFAQTLIPSSE